jgi:hypothetical protein
VARTAKLTFKPGKGITLKSYKIDEKNLNATEVEATAPALAPGRALEHLVSVDGDGAGGLIVGARLLYSDDDPQTTPSLVIRRMAVSGDAGTVAPVGEALFLRDSSFAYVGQPYVVAPDGRVVQPVGSKSGYTIVVHYLPATAGATPADAGLGSADSALAAASDPGLAPAAPATAPPRASTEAQP